MSKKHQSGSSNVVTAGHTAEYRIIKHDLIKVVVLNVLYLAAILALYYSNKQSGFLEQWFSKVFKF